MVKTKINEPVKQFCKHMDLFRKVDVIVDKTIKPQEIRGKKVSF